MKVTFEMLTKTKTHRKNKKNTNKNLMLYASTNAKKIHHTNEQNKNKK